MSFALPFALSLAMGRAVQASNTVQATTLQSWNAASSVSANDLKPSYCSAQGTTLTSINAGSGTFSASAANQLVLGSSGGDTVTVVAGDNGDCVDVGAGGSNDSVTNLASNTYCLGQTGAVLTTCNHHSP